MEVHVPIEIIRLILLKLKVKSVIRFECVCKEWRSTIQDPDFKLYYRGRKRVMVMPRASGSLAVTFTTTTPRIETLFRVSDNPTSFLNPNTPLDHGWSSGVWCSCNGLVLFSVRQHILLWNPSTRCCTKVLELPPSYNTYRPRPDALISGLCYVSSTRDYKVVLLLQHESTVMVASLKHKKWRNVPFPYHALTTRDYGVNFHNTLHWRVIPSSCLFGAFDCHTIVYFETERDEFKELPISTPERKKSYIIVGLGIMDDCLCLARGTSYEIEVLVMKEYGVRRSWVSQFVISTPTPITRYLSITLYSLKCNTKVLIWRQGVGKLVVYDLKNNTLNNNFLPESVGYWGPVCIRSYVESLVSPYEFIWRDDPHKPPENDVVLRFILERFNI